MPKRKTAEGDDIEGDETVPLPIQLFFWRQTSPFIRPKHGKLCEASCVSFERVVVQNILHGLSPSLCEAIHSVSRWKTIKAAFPHLMHACAAIMRSRKDSNPEVKFNNNETKLLYTLHWTLLDAASECEDASSESNNENLHLYMHSLSSIQLFVYLFAPHVNTLHESDFESLKLENGLRLWQPLWNYTQPDIPCFSTPVKPQRNMLKAQHSVLRFNTNAANIYIGKGTSTEKLFPIFETFSLGEERGCKSEPHSPTAPLARMSDICAFSVSDSQSANVEVLCEHCNSVMPLQPLTSDPNMACRCGRKDSFVAFLHESRQSVYQKLTSPVDQDYMKQRLASAMTSGTRGGAEAADILSASFFDVAILQCLFCLNWAEDGVFWALKYYHNRLLEITDEYLRRDITDRGRSQSLPIPNLFTLQKAGKIPILLVNSDKSSTDTLRPPARPRASVGDVQGLQNLGIIPESNREPPYKRIRVVDLNQFFDSGSGRPNIKRRLDKNMSDSDNLPSRIAAQDLKGDTIPHALSHSDLEGLAAAAEASGLSMRENRQERIRNLPKLDFSATHKQMSSHLYHSDKDSSCSGPNSVESTDSPCTDTATGGTDSSTKHPIITITEEKKSLAASFYELPENFAGGHDESTETPGSDPVNVLPRSLTDSNINYFHNEEEQEVAGSVHYIQKNGHLNYKVLLLAVHFIATYEHSLRVCEVLLNLISCLLDMNIIEAKIEEKQPEKANDDGASKAPDEAKPAESKKSDGGDTEITAHELAMDSVVRIFKSLGCPYGCGDSVRGHSGDQLRMKAQNCLLRLHRLHPELFCKYLQDCVKNQLIQETVDFLHACLGFCIDPQSLLHSPQAPRKSFSQEGLSKNGYANNFGHSFDGVGYRGVEGVLVANILKPFVSKCCNSIKEIHGHENISLFCDVRQFICYTKEVHGGMFRKVALSGLLDSLKKILKEMETREKDKSSPHVHLKLPRGLRRRMSMAVDSEETKNNPLIALEDPSQFSKPRKSIFRKKIRKPLLLQQYSASDSELLEERFQGKLSPRTSISADEDPPSGPSTPRRKFSKFQIGWRRQCKSDHEDDSAGESAGDRKESRSEIYINRLKGKMSFKAAGHATLTFLSARKRAEDGLKFGRRQSKMGGGDDRRFSIFDALPNNNDNINSESVLVKEKKLVDKFIVKSGMWRFSFLLDCCPPGTFPDPQLVAVMLELEAPVVARAGFLLETAYFIHRCNKGDWASWMKLNLPSFTRSAGPLYSRGQPSGYRRNLALQRNAGKLFHSWAENLGMQMEYVLGKEHADRLSIIEDVKEDGRRRELRLEDEEEDFLDEATVNPGGSDCPYALKMIACQVLVEITTFLRETLQYIPKSKLPRRETGWERSAPSQRLSSVISTSSPGHSERSNESVVGELPQTTAVTGSPGDRKISFAVLTERSDSIHSSTTSLSIADTQETKVGPKKLGQTRGKLLKHFRRGSNPSNSFRHNRSFKLKRQDDKGGGTSGSIKRFGSISSRKISSQSLRSEDKSVETGEPSNEDLESIAVHSDEAQESPSELPEVDESVYYQNMPWIKVVVQLANLSNFICTHQNYCHPNCYERQRRSCTRLITALQKVYHSTEEEQKKEEEKRAETKPEHSESKNRMKRRDTAFQQQSSPVRRKESTPLLDKIKSDISLTKLKLNATKKEEKPKEIKEDAPILKYLNSQGQKLIQSPMVILTKAAPILNEDNFIDIMPVAWELMLESDQELAAAAASVFLLSSVKSPEKAQEMLVKELQHQDVNQRINAVLRFGTLWRFRFQVWPRMEEGANLFFKVPPPNIDFTLPSPTIGLPMMSVIDPPWTPHFKAKIEEVTLNQEATGRDAPVQAWKSLVTATTTRRKQQQEMIRKALLAEEERKRIGRENFPMTTIPITISAAYEPALHHGGEEHEEAMQEEINLAARRVSLAPVNRANIQSRSLSWRSSSIYWGRLEGEEERPEHAHHFQQAQLFFPSVVCTTVLPIIHLLDDTDVNTEGTSVAEVVERTVWNCIVEDPVLFLRHFLEKITSKEKQEELLFLLRKILLFYKDLPAQLAHSIFNYMIGFIMFHVRSPTEGGLSATSGALALLWQVIPSVEGIYFKDLKQTLKKEQCDPYLLISANVPGAKKVIVHGPDLSSIPSQFPIHEDTQFSQVLQDSLDFFNIPDEEHKSYFLADTKSGQMISANSYVRDIYFFRRNVYPQLDLVKKEPEVAFLTLQKQAFLKKFVELGKVMFTTAVLRSTPVHQIQNHVDFLHEEFLRLPAFPRKAMEAEFDLHYGEWGKEIYGMDTLHKYSWVKLMSSMFKSMMSTFNWGTDFLLFLNVINGALILHCEDSSMLRYCLAVLVDTSRHFKHVFATNGFMHIMPTILRVYSNNQPNPVICQAIHYVCKQFYILHRKPFILQMFGSAAPLLDMTSAQTGLIDCNKIQPECLFKLLKTFDHNWTDTLGILDLVDGEKPLSALDFCYENSPEICSVLDVINMCVTVIAYAPDSFRTTQMLAVLQVVIPHHLKDAKKDTMKKENATAARMEISIILSTGVSVKALLMSSEYFTRSLSLPEHQYEAAANVGTAKPQQNHLGTSVYYEEKDDSSGRHVEEGRRKHQPHEEYDEEERTEFRKPRDSLLAIAAEFHTTSLVRLRELRKVLADPNFRMPDLLDARSHNRLADIANTLLKLAAYDQETMSCTGLQRYMTELLVNTDWSQEAVRPALNLILRRLDRLFTKISKKPILKRQLDWDAAANLLKSVYSTLKKFHFIAHLPHLKTLINVLITIILSTSGSGYDNSSGYSSREGTQSVGVPTVFCSVVIKLIAMQVQILGDQFSLEFICGGTAHIPSTDRCLNLLLNLVLPLCIRVGCGRRDSPRLRQADLNFALALLLNILLPASKQSNQHQNSAKHHHLSVSDQSRSSSFSNMDKGHLKVGLDFLQQTAFLGLEILMVCFDKSLAGEFHRVAKCILDISSKSKGVPLWKFLDYVVTYRPSIFILLNPFIQFRMMKINCDTAQEYYLQQTVKDKMQGYTFAHPKSDGKLLAQLACELRLMREEYLLGTDYRSRSTTMVSERSDMPQTQLPDRIPRASIADVTAEIIGASNKPSLAAMGKRASRATIYSRSSSIVSAFKNPTAPNDESPNNGSPNSHDDKKTRITARDGTKILEKFKKPTVDEPCPEPTPSSPKIQRHPVFRSPVTKQRSVDEAYPAAILYENEETANGGALQLLQQKEGIQSPEEPRGHRLQRADAKSRKTFKIRRQKTKTTGSLSIRPHISKSNKGDTEGKIIETSPLHGDKFSIEQLQMDKSEGQTSLAKSVETIPETIAVKTSRPRYVPRSKSHDDPSGDIHAPAGTVRGRIARHGARIIRSRSPSTSPVRGVRSANVSPACSQAYIAHSDSSDSIGNETSALLKDDEKCQSPTSLCVYFDTPETCV